jgi:plasmid stabilization system protein ParE
MNRPVIFRPAARQDLLDACTWYEQRRAGLGSRFADSVERALETISKSPESFPSVHRDVRRPLVRPFPYGIFYRTRGETIHILAVMHGHRDPVHWKSRANVE